MKKIVLIILVILVILVGAVISIPLFFKDSVKKMAVEKANNLLDATISYESFSLTLFRSFPDMKASFKQMALVGTDVFEGDTLVSFLSLSAEIDLLSLIKKRELLVRSLDINRLSVHLLVNDEGLANWKIAKQQDVTGEDNQIEKPDSARKDMLFLLDRVRLDQFCFVYENRKRNYLLGIYDADADLKGKMEGKMTELAVGLKTPSVNFFKGDARYVENRSLELHTELLADLEKNHFRFKTEGSQLNGMPLDLEGGFQLPEEGMEFDFRFDVPDFTMEKLLALLPDRLKRKTEKMEVSGTVNLNGSFTGTMKGKDLPAADIRLNILNGKLKYPGLPDAVMISEAAAVITKPQGTMDKMIVGLTKFNMKMAENPVSLSAQLSNILSDPYMDINVDGTLDLKSLPRIFPMEGVIMNGTVRAKATIKGNYSSVEKEDYTAFISRGNFGMDDLYLQNKTFPQGVSVHDASIDLHNQDLRIWKLQGAMGRSDFFLKGRLANFISYAMGDGQLQGNLELVSNLMDANEFLQNREKKKEADKEKDPHPDSTKTEDKPLTFPPRMHLVFQSQIASLLYDKQEINSFKGKIELKDQQVTLQGLEMNLLGGFVGMNGTVIADGRPSPDIALELVADGIDLHSAWRTIDLVQKYLPFAEKTQGELSSVFSLKTNLGRDVKMILSGLTAKGNLSTKGVKLIDQKSLNSLRNVIQPDKLQNMQLNDFKADFEITDGNLILKPFKTAFAGQPVALSGKYNIGGAMEFRMDTNLKKEILAKNIQDIISYVPGHESIKTIDVGIDVTGDFKNPVVAVDAAKIRNQVIDQVKKSSKEELKDAAKKLFDKFLK